MDATALLISGFIENSFVVQANRFDESAEQPVVDCGSSAVIDANNIFATDPETALVGLCERP